MQDTQLPISTLSDFHDEDLFDDYPSLLSVAPFLALAENVNWFRALGETPNSETRTLARDYCDMLGFPEAEPGFFRDWFDAADGAESLDMNSPGWEAEEQMRAGLTSDILAMIPEDVFEMVMAHVMQAIAPMILDAVAEAADYLRIEDKSFATAAEGAAFQACHTAALVMMAGEESNHPFAIRFRIFEEGRWPIGIIGSSFLIY